jgi:hypothetical protein
VIDETETRLRRRRNMSFEINQNGTGMVSVLHTFTECGINEEEKQAVRADLKRKLFLLICDRIQDKRSYSLVFETTETTGRGYDKDEIEMRGYILLTYYSTAKVGEYVSPGISTTAADVLATERADFSDSWRFVKVFGMALQRIK